MSPEESRDSLFAHPLTFFVTHVVFPLLTAAAVSYLDWISCDSWPKDVVLKASLFVGAAWLLPLAAIVVLAFRPKRMNATMLFLWAFAGAAFLYLGVPVAHEMVRNVEGWVFGPTPFFLLFAGMVPLIFAGLARVATARWTWFGKYDAGASLACLLLPPTAVFVGGNVIFAAGRAWKRGVSPIGEAILAHLLTVGIFLVTALFFVGLLRCLHRLYGALASSSAREYRFLPALLFGLVLPLSGLCLNMSIPFPADFQNPWAWGLALLTGLVLMLPVPATGWGLAAYFARFVVAPFVLYFFLLFIPFLPLAIPAILLVGAGFLILAPTLLFRAWTRDVYAAYRTLRGAYSRRRLVLLAVAGFLVMPMGFIVVTEVERHDLAELIAWQTKESFDELEPPPPPMSLARAKAVMQGVNDYTFGAEIPLLSAWRTWRVYGGMYMADKLRNDLNRRILGWTVEDTRSREKRARNGFAGSMFGFNSARRSSNRGGSSRWVTRPPRTMDYEATAQIAASGTNGVYEVLIRALPAKVESELILDFRVPAGTWIETMELKMADGAWKKARATERKAAEWVYNKITEQRRDPSIVTMDTPTTGRIKVFPVGKDGREVRLRVRRPALAGDRLISFAAVKKGGLLPWRDVAVPSCEGNVKAPGASIVTDREAGVSGVSAAWFAEHAAEAAPSVVGCDTDVYDVDDPALMSKLRRRVRFAATHMAERPGMLPNFLFVKTVDATNRVETATLPRGALTEVERAILRRELPGLEVFGDRPVDGWFALPAANGGKVAVPYRKGEDALVFAALAEGAADPLWHNGAAAWRLDQEAFLNPARDARRELLEKTRAGHALTTQTSLIVVETATQEKGLQQKEFETLHGDKAMDIDESSATSGDAPGFLLLAFGLLVLVAWKRWRLRRLLWGR